MGDGKGGSPEIAKPTHSQTGEKPTVERRTLLKMAGGVLASMGLAAFGPHSKSVDAQMRPIPIKPTTPNESDSIIFSNARPPDSVYIPDDAQSFL